MVLLTFVGLVIRYNLNLGPVSDSTALKEVEIKKGMSSNTIAQILKDKNLIKDKDTFVLYLKLNKINDYNYGIYLLQENMGVKEIVKLLREGSTYNPNEIKITIQEGLNMREIAKIIEKNTNNTYDSVIDKSNDINYIKTLIEKYWFITDDILNNELYYKLEGYLYPDTYILENKDVSVEYIFNKMINEMSKKLQKYVDYDYSALSIHQRLTLASMVEKESSVSNDRSKMASVFLNRMNLGMNLGSDVTARYANKIDDRNKKLSSSQFQYKSKYNTRLNDGSMDGKLPIGPISTVSISSIEAAFNPSDGNYLYFISNIETLETFYYENYNDFLKKKNELATVNQGF